MSTIYNLELESEIKKLGFKKKWLSDKSGKWFEFNRKHKDLKLKFIVQSDIGKLSLFIMQIQTFEYIGWKMHKGNYEDVAKFPCDIKSIKSVLKRYK